MSFTQASVLPCRFVFGGEEQELSVSPSGCPTYLSLRGQRKVGQRKATPRPRPSRIPARRVRVSPWVFVDRPSLACHEHRPHPCGRPCGLIHELPPLPRGPVKSAGSCPPEPRQRQRQWQRATSEEPKAKSGEQGAKSQKPRATQRCSAAHVVSKKSGFVIPAKSLSSRRRARGPKGRVRGARVLRSSGRYVSATMGAPAGLDRLPQRRSRLSKSLAPLNPR